MSGISGLNESHITDQMQNSFSDVALKDWHSNRIHNRVEHVSDNHAQFGERFCAEEVLVRSLADTSDLA